MLKRRLIPKLQVKSLQFGKITRSVLVTTYKFQDEIVIGDPISQAKIYQAQIADELIFLDLSSKDSLRPQFVELLREVSMQVFMPFTVGGGVKTLEDFRILLENGADKISINSAALQDPLLIAQAAKKFGSQCVVVSIDYMRNTEGILEVYSHNGKVKTAWGLKEWMQEVVARGAGEILLTCIDRDGTTQGLDVVLAKEVIATLPIPVILSGGCGLASHFIDGFSLANASGVAAGTFFCFKDQNPMQTRAQIKNANISIRMLC